MGSSLIHRNNLQIGARFDDVSQLHEETEMWSSMKCGSVCGLINGCRYGRWRWRNYYQVVQRFAFGFGGTASFWNLGRGVWEGKER